MRATSAAFVLVEREAGRDRAGALDEQPHRLVAERSSGASGGVRVGDRERRDAEDDLARDAQRLAAGREDVSRGAARSSASASAALAPSTCSQLSSTSSSVARREEAGERVDEAPAGQRAHVERGGDRVRDERALRDGGELDERRAVGVRVLGGARELEREPRLAGAAGAGEREQARAPRAVPELRELVLAADEGARLGGQPERPAPDAEPSSSAPARRASAASSLASRSAQSS